MFYFKFCQDNAFVVIVLSTFQIYIYIPRVNKQETYKQTNKHTVTKYIYNGKMSEMDFLFTINIHRKQIIKFKKIFYKKFNGLQNGIMLRVLYFRITSKNNFLTMK